MLKITFYSKPKFAENQSKIFSQIFKNKLNFKALIFKVCCAFTTLLKYLTLFWLVCKTEDNHPFNNRTFVEDLCSQPSNSGAIVVRAVALFNQLIQCQYNSCTYKQICDHVLNSDILNVERNLKDTLLIKHLG